VVLICGIVAWTHPCTTEAVKEKEDIGVGIVKKIDAVGAKIRLQYQR